MIIQRLLFMAVLSVWCSSATAMFTIFSQFDQRAARKRQQGVEQEKLLNEELEKKSKENFDQMHPEAVADDVFKSDCQQTKIVDYMARYAPERDDLDMIYGNDLGKLESKHGRIVRQRIEEGSIDSKNFIDFGLEMGGLLRAADELCFEEHNTLFLQQSIWKKAHEQAKQEMDYDQKMLRAKELQENRFYSNPIQTNRVKSPASVKLPARRNNTDIKVGSVYQYGDATE